MAYDATGHNKKIIINKYRESHSTAYSWCSRRRVYLPGKSIGHCIMNVLNLNSIVNHCIYDEK